MAVSKSKAKEKKPKTSQEMDEVVSDLLGDLGKSDEEIAPETAAQEAQQKLEEIKESEEDVNKIIERRMTVNDQHFRYELLNNSLKSIGAGIFSALLATAAVSAFVLY